MNSNPLTLTFSREHQCDQLTRTLHLTLGEHSTLTVNQDVSDFNAEISKRVIAVADIQDVGYLIATTFTQATTLQLCIDADIANILYPQSFVEAVAALAINNIELSYLNDAMMLKQGFGGLMSIAQGSDREARLLCLDYHPQDPKFTVALVGKGVTFDSGGISIKQPRYMSTMKVDMGGAAAVVGALNAIAQLQLPIRVIGLCGLVENMPSGKAIKPGDVVTMLNKTNVEIITTDAEGRMVLADVLHYAQQHYQPDYLVDIATLTGGTGIALGKAYASLMGNDNNLIASAQTAGQACSEPLWPMPTGGMFTTALESDFADLRHGSEEPDGSPCVAATFLEHFIQPDQKWIHIDSAAMSLGMNHRKIYPKATTGYGTLLLTELCQQLILQDRLHQ
jgi:leucyl aminopeptidase